MIDVVVLGPVPGSAGGVGVMMDYLESTTSDRSRIRFLDSGGSPGPAGLRLWSFIKAGVTSIGRDSRPTVYLLSTSSGGSTWRKLVLSALLRIRRKPYVLHLHGGWYRDFLKSVDPVRRGAIRSMFGAAAGVAVLGEAWADFVRRDLGVAEDRVVLLPNSVPGPETVPERTGPDTVLFAGRVGVRKGAGSLLTAWQNLRDVVDPETVLVLAGDLDDPDGSITEAVDAAQNVELLGWVVGPQLQEQFARSRVLALPSQAENLPLSLLEGMAWGLVPVVTPVGAVPEVIDDGRNGLLVPVYDSNALEQALRRVLTDAKLRDEMAAAARSTWESDYALDRYRPRFDDIVEAAYQEHAAAHGRPHGRRKRTA